MKYQLIFPQGHTATADKHVRLNPHDEIIIDSKRYVFVARKKWWQKIFRKKAKSKDIIEVPIEKTLYETLNNFCEASGCSLVAIEEAKETPAPEAQGEEG